MTSADNFFWTFEQAVSYYQFALVNYIGFHDSSLPGDVETPTGDRRLRKPIILSRHMSLGREFIRGTGENIAAALEKICGALNPLGTKRRVGGVLRQEFLFFF